MGMTNDTATTTGWVVFVAALGMLFGMVAVDIAGLKEWSEANTPFFVGTTVGHIGAVIAAFVGGKMIPAARDSQQTRSTDREKPTDDNQAA